jgi:hypothetical protein
MVFNGVFLIANGAEGRGLILLVIAGFVAKVEQLYYRKLKN